MKRYADEDKIWVCSACGKWSSHDLHNSHKCRMWDVSCIMNALEVEKSKCVFKENRVVEIKDAIINGG